MAAPAKSGNENFFDRSKLFEMEKAKNTSNQDGQEAHHPRKRKLDKDGFVCPTTPDIPRNSHQFVEDGKHKKFDALESMSNFPTFGGDFGLADGAFVSSYFKARSGKLENKLTKISPCQPGISNTSCDPVANNLSVEINNINDVGSQAKKDPEQGQLTRQESQGFEVGEEGIENQPGDKTNIYDTYNSGFIEEENKSKYETLSSQPNKGGAASQESSMNFLQSLVKGFEKESTAMFENWGKTFGQCGEYELLCQQRLDGMIQNAKSIENSLNSKKDALCNRLKGIGKTLET